MPTILSILDIPFSHATSGVNLLPLLQGEKEKFLDLPVFIENGLSFDSKEDYKNSRDGNDVAITYPNIFQLLEMEDEFPYYLCIKKEFVLPVLQAKWRKLLKNNSSVVYIPMSESGGSFETFDNLSNSEKNDHDMTNELRNYMLQESATIFNGNDLIEYKN